jgi:hypothetical protein
MGNIDQLTYVEEMFAIKIKTPMKTFNSRTISHTQFTFPLVPSLSNFWVAKCWS